MDKRFISCGCFYAWFELLRNAYLARFRSFCQSLIFLGCYMLTHNTHYATSSKVRPSVYPLPVHLGFNSAASTSVHVYFRLKSDLRDAEALVLSYHGLFWFCLRVKGFKDINSIGFVDSKACISSALSTFKYLGYSVVRVPLESVSLLIYDKVLWTKICQGARHVVL